METDFIEQVGVLVKDKLDRILDNNRKYKKRDIKFLSQLIVDLKLFQVRTNGGIDDYTR